MIWLGKVIINTLLISFQKDLDKICTNKSNLNMSSFEVAKSDPLKLEALSFFLPNLENVEIKPTVGGVNNYCDHIILYDDITKPELERNILDRFVLRIYNNGLDRPRVDFEHSVLQKLLELSKTSFPLSFKIPTSMVSIKDSESTRVILSNGYEATLFEYIPGILPKKKYANDIGRASGELVSALSQIDLDVMSPNPRFCDIYKAHHATTRDIFFQEMSKSIFDKDPMTRHYIDLLAEEVRKIEKVIEYLHTVQLPLQLIHADLHYDNVLCDGDIVSGLLDFEFSVHDWRACEIAVALSKYAGESDALELFTHFTQGYATTAVLTEKEINAIPDLIILRVLSNVVYFVGRNYAGEDTIDILVNKAETYYTRIKWIHDHKQDIVNILKICVK